MNYRILVKSILMSIFSTIAGMAALFVLVWAVLHLPMIREQTIALTMAGGAFLFIIGVSTIGYYTKWNRGKEKIQERYKKDVE